MKSLRLLVVLFVSSALVGFAADASATKPEPKKPACCLKAEKEGKKCEKPCCVAAAKEGKVCEKCLKAGGKKKNKKADQ